MRKLSSLSIFFPAYNDALSLPNVIAAADRVAKTCAKRYEIIIINDGSTDQTGVVLKTLTRTYPALRVVTHTKNQGYGKALRSGFSAARYDWVFYTDGDGQYDPSELALLVKRVSGHTDVINGFKRNRQDAWYRKLLGHWYNLFVQFRFHPPIRDIDCDFRLIRRSLLKNVMLKSTSGTICVELITQLHKNGARFEEIPVHHYPRLHGTSKFFSFSHIRTTFSELLAIIK